MNCRITFKPHEGAVWDSQATIIHGLTEHNPKIIGADGMDFVWPRFLQRFAYHLKREEVAVLVTYNGETCNLKWLWKLTQAPRSLYCLPPEMEYFMIDTPTETGSVHRQLLHICQIGKTNV